MDLTVVIASNSEMACYKLQFNALNRSGDTPTVTYCVE